MPPASAPDIANLARKLRAGDRATLARAITLIESKRADHQRQAHQLVQELLPGHRQGGARRHHRHARRRQVDHHRRARHLSDRERPQGRGAGGRPLVHPHRRLDPRRQDPHGAAGERRERLHPPLARRRHARRRRGENPRDHADLRGRGLRRDPGRDRRHRAVGDRGRRHDRLLPRADAARRAATNCRASRRAWSRSPT